MAHHDAAPAEFAAGHEVLRQEILCSLGLLAGAEEPRMISPFSAVWYSDPRASMMRL